MTAEPQQVCSQLVADSSWVGGPEALEMLQKRATGAARMLSGDRSLRPLHVTVW